MPRRAFFAPLFVIVWLLYDSQISAQSTQTREAFEVASIKPAPDCDSTRPISVTADRLILPCVTVRVMIRIAYNLISGNGDMPPSLGVLGGPSWIDNDTYRLEAKAESKTSPVQLRGPLLQALIEDRLQVKVHKEFIDKPVYELTVAKSNPNLRPVSEESCIQAEMNANIARAIATNPSGQPKPRYCGSGIYTNKDKGMILVADWTAITIPNFAGRGLASFVGRSVIDKTGLTGRFDIHLEFVRDRIGSGVVMLNGVAMPEASMPSSDPMGPSIFKALKDQLGLSLTPANGPVEVIVIDNVEKPSAD